MKNQFKWEHDYNGSGASIRFTHGNDEVLDLVNNSYSDLISILTDGFKKSDGKPVMILAFPTYPLENNRLKTGAFLNLKNGYGRDFKKGYHLMEIVGEFDVIMRIRKNLLQSIQDALNPNIQF